MKYKNVSIVIILLSSFLATSQSQEVDIPALSRHNKGYTLERALSEIPHDALPLILKIRVPRDEVVAGENFPIQFTITNPNPTALRLIGGGRYRPSLYAGLNDNVLSLFVEESLDLPSGRNALLLAPGESASITMIRVFPRTGTIASSLYSKNGYTLRMRASGVVGAVQIEETGCPEVICKWESEEIHIPVRAPTVHERNSYLSILDWNEMHRDPAPGVTLEEWTLASVDFYRRFLDEYGETPYSNLVRIMLLRDLEKLPRQISDKNGKPLPPLFTLYVNTVSEILDSGLPYAAKIDKHVLSTLVMSQRWDLLATTLEKHLSLDVAERTLDDTFSTVARQYCDKRLPELQKNLSYEMKQRIRNNVLQYIDRCATWEGYRAIQFDQRVFAFLSEEKQWNLMELAALRTIETATLTRDCSGQQQSERLTDDSKAITAAKEALSVARRKLEKLPQ